MDVPLHFRDYWLLPVLNSITPELRERVCTFWLKEHALPSRAAAERRTSELVYVVENAVREIVGVSTAYVAVAPRLGKSFYFYRTFVRREDRTPRLWQYVLQATWALLYARTTHGTVFGVIAAAENPKFARPGTRREFQKLGWDYLGTNPRGQHTWIKPF